MFAEPEFWVAVAFLILLGVFAYLGVHRTVLTTLDHRRDRIRAELDDARRLKDEAAFKVELRQAVRQQVGDVIRQEPCTAPGQAGVLTITGLVPSPLATPKAPASHSPTSRDLLRAPESEAEEIITGAKADAERIASEARAKMEDFVVRRTKTAESKIALAEAQALADVRAAAAEAAIAAASTILSQSVKGEVADDLLSKGIQDVREKLN